MSQTEIPTYDSMMNPLIQALKELGGSGTVEEIDNRVGKIMALSDEQLEVLQDPKRGGRTKFGY